MDKNKIVEMNFVYKQLKESVDKAFSSFEDFAVLTTAKDNQMNKSSVEIDSPMLSIYSTLDNGIEFGLFDEKFWLEATIYPNANRCAVFNTYQIIINRKSFPHKELILIPSMAIMLSIDGLLIFINNGNAIGKFNTAYIHALCDFYQSNKIKW